MKSFAFNVINVLMKELVVFEKKKKKKNGHIYKILY